MPGAAGHGLLQVGSPSRVARSSAGASLTHVWQIQSVPACRGVAYVRAREVGTAGAAGPQWKNRYAMQIAATTPARSAISPHATACLVFRTDTEPKYRAMM